jgi:protein-S-isoprenylcysteine O-methyltransferase Ste14
MRLSEWGFVVAFGISVWIRARGERLSANRRTVAAPHARADAMLIGGMALGTVVLPTFHLTTNWVAFADYQLPWLANLSGAVLALSALWLFERAHRDLGPNWSRRVAITEHQLLVTSGVYSLMRHPMYTALWLFSLAQALLLHNGLAGWSGAVAFAAMYFYRLPREERLLEQHFGDCYQQYRRNTPRHWRWPSV